MIRSALKNNLILSLIIFNLILMLSLIFSEINTAQINNKHLPPTISKEIRWAVSGCIILFGALFIMYSFNNIIKANKKIINSESSNRQDF